MSQIKVINVIHPSGSTNNIVNDSSGNVTIGGTVAANGVVFPATQVSSAGANTLDDYEEGSWTPTATPDTGSITTYSSTGTYTKIGNVVNIAGTITLTTVGTAAGQVTIGALPFTLNSFNAYGVVRETAATGTIYFIRLNASATTAVIGTSTNGAITWTNGYIYRFSATYFTS